MIMQVVLCVICMFFILLLNLKIEFKNRVLKFLGGISFEVYLIHDIFRWLLLKSEKNGMSDALYIGLTFVLSIAAACIFSMVDKYLLDFYKRYPSIIYSFRRPKFDDDTPIQIRKDVLKKRVIVSVVKMLYIIAFIGVLVTEGITMCKCFK